MSRIKKEYIREMEKDKTVLIPAKNSPRVILLWIILFQLMVTSVLQAQTYGLRFASHDVLKENRTSLDLNHDNFFSFNDDFELSFGFRLNQHNNMYFGYVVRIIDNENRNVDMIFNYQSRSQNSFDIVYQNNLIVPPIKTDIASLFNHWEEFRFYFDLKSDILKFVTADTVVELKGIELTGKIKILFGASDYGHFKTTDVPPMSIKDVRISTKGKLAYEWLLNESEGTTAHETLKNKDAHVINPIWLSPIFQNWVNAADFLIEGNAEIVFNPKDEIVYVIGDNNLISYYINENRIDSITYLKSPKILKAGCQAFYEPDSNMLVSYNIDLKTFSTFEFETKTWNQMESDFYPLTVYWHHNKFYSSAEKSLFTFGGYGQHEYKNSINKFSLITKNWETIKPSGESFPPRYLASLGHLNDTIYILGGYGSISGKQILNPQNYYDLWAYSLKDNNFSLIYEFVPPVEDIVFANSMVIDNQTYEFYALAFPIFKHESILQLYRGSLKTPGLVPVGNTFPYTFHDIISYADLFHAKQAKKLIAVTTLYNEHNQTNVRIHFISFPPNQSDSFQHPVNLTVSKKIFLILAIILSIAGLFSFLYFTKRKNFKKVSYQRDSESVEVIHNRNSIFFFGDFQFLDKQGTDLTYKFSPLLKELFLLIWFNSLKDKGISSERIIDILWFDKDEKSAKNNLSVNMAKLKQILSEIESLKVSRQTGYWTILFDENIVFNDYHYCLKLAHSKENITRQQIEELICVSQKGHFLESCAFSWLDEYKAELSNLIIDTLLLYAKNVSYQDDSDFILHLADAILNFDLMSEEAIQLKCKALVIQGKHHLARETFSKFTKEYKSLYNSSYPKTFLDITK